MKVCIIQARCSSSRLPGKVLLPLNGVPMILYQLNRVSEAKSIDKIVVATSTNSSDDLLAHTIQAAGYEVPWQFRKCIDRYYRCAKSFRASTIIRLTGDCPFISPEIIDFMVDQIVNLMTILAILLTMTFLMCTMVWMMKFFLCQPFHELGVKHI